MSRPAYRADIDGLRAVAVLPVVLFHAGFAWMPGGFVGVDVFFVISGYLITTIVSREIAAGAFSLLHFYERRIRRILPALFAVIAVVLVGATILFVPSDLANAAQSAAAAALFSANVLFWLEAGYFDAASYGKPLLHTWSLGIEEQFYIVLPILLIAVARRGGRMLPWVAGITAVSLALSVATTPAVPTAAYYLLPWRAWELGLGALLALGAVPAIGRPWLREVAAAAGLAMILASALLITRATPFPGAAALVPTLGAALVIHAGREGATGAGRLLSTALPVWIGRISYSLYLWHWPVIVAFVYLALRMPSGAEAAGLIALSVALAWVSFRFIEQPFRHGGDGRTRRRIFGAAALGTGAVVALAGLVVVTGGLPGRLPEDARRIAAFSWDTPEWAGPCYRRKTSEETWSVPCVFGAEAGAARLAVWGDSHAPTLVPALDEAARARGIAVALYARDGCPPIETFEVYWVGQAHDCSAYLAETYRAILADPAIDRVVIALRAQIYTQGWHADGLAERDRTPLLVGTDDAVLSPDADRTAFFLAGLDRTVAALRAAGKSVALVYPLPEAGFDVPAGVMRATLWRNGDPHVPRAAFDGRAAAIIAGYDAIVARHGAIPIRLDQAVCGAESCPLVFEGAPIFRDSNHLTQTAARALEPHLLPALADLGRETLGD
ncbi:acyltransferase family protein [Jannaschia sp. W003]|uniref:acyltransferase family protein n=1 Tax=Jannaschia sp. W003 TaxID=2867012 RepID=UPI0021A8A849|nr:acyltransferase family protein [Jannaschia sp. W003]UWQ21564.1 acyltransferase [Jannaschia sp. W003]